MFKPGWRLKLRAFLIAFRRPRLRRMMMREARRQGARKIRRTFRR